MIERRKRERVVAEITAAHLMLFVHALGRFLTREQAVAFLNRDDRAYATWKHMMHASDDYIKRSLERLQPIPRISVTALGNPSVGA